MYLSSALSEVNKKATIFNYAKGETISLKVLSARTNILIYVDVAEVNDWNDWLPAVYVQLYITI